MSEYRLTAGPLRAVITNDGIALDADGWDGFALGPAICGAAIDGASQAVAARRTSAEPGAIVVTTDLAPAPVSLIQTIADADGAITVRTELSNRADRPVSLDAVTLLATAAGAAARFGVSPQGVRVFEQGGYWARVRGLGARIGRDSVDGETPEQVRATHASENVSVMYDRAARMALLIGMETNERWTGRIASEGAERSWPERLAVEFDGGATLIPAGARIPLEDIVLIAGSDPLDLLDQYAERLSHRHAVGPLPEHPVSWCSWYAYRLGVTEDRILANARIAAERLQPLGHRIMELDLGWERAYLPSAFEENGQFPHGLRWLADRLEEMGFVLGAWKGPFTISALDPVASEHPEWLLGTADARPAPQGDWFWEPHGQTYSLDLTHPGAQEWLRQRMASLGERGVRYLKPDFIGGVMSEALRERHDCTIVVGGGVEAARIGMRIIQDSLRAANRDALVLNCGCPDMPGAGAFPLLYTCNDTGNTGYVGWNHLREDYGRCVAGHLFKNNRWGVLQPSCLVVGLPGTLEEARARAQATFLCGGQVDISDDLTTLPEDRWSVLLSTLPTMGMSARPIDLFDPIQAASMGYEAMCRGLDAETGGEVDADHSRVWVLPITTDWDEWQLVGLFNYNTNDDVEYGKASITRFRIPLERLGIDAGIVHSAYEFWSGQYLGEIPALRANPRGYVHPGDTQPLIASPEPDILEVAFFGPSVKLLAIRRARVHPWPAGTTFHQSGGADLRGVTWNGEDTLTGTLHRPAGQQGAIVISSDRGMPRETTVGGQTVTPRTGANGSVVVPVSTHEAETPWVIRW